jgi:hypothetical protein
MQTASTAIAIALLVLTAAPARGQAPVSPPAASPPQEIAVAPIECWWKTDRNAVRVGEQFMLTLTCAVLDTERVQVVVDESGLSPTALHLVPFEIVGGQRFRDILNSPRKFFQYQYTMRVIGEEFFGKEITLPQLQLTYRVQNSLTGGAALAGRQEVYTLRPVPLRVLSLVPPGTQEIRDRPIDSFGDVDSRLFRSNLLLMVAGVTMGLAALVAIGALARTAVRRRSKIAAKHRMVSPGMVLRAASGELASVRKASEQDGWNGDLAGRAAAALRLAGAVALNRPVSQREGDRDAAATEGQVVVGRGIRGKKLILSSGVTASVKGRNGASPLWQGLSQSLSVFTAARYSKNGSVDGTALDGALSESQDLIKRLRLHQLRTIGRRKAPQVSEHGIQTWAR